MEPSVALKEEALRLGFDTVGVCAAQQPPHFDAYAEWLDNGRHGSMSYLLDHLPLKRHPENLLPGCRSVVAVTLNYNQTPPADPKIARYALGRDYHKVMRSKLRRLAEFLTQRHPESAFRPCVDSAPIMERDFAQMAGLGWFGKNTMLIDSRRGSWFFIGILLSTVEFEPDTPSRGSCGTCTRCLDACPTGAIVFADGRWQVDARTCISYQTIEHRGPLEVDPQGWVFGCDVCQEVCPFNQPRDSQPLRAQPTREPDFLRVKPWPPASEIAALDYEEWDELTKGTAVRRSGYDGLRRNGRGTMR